MADASRFDVVASSEVPPEDLIWTRPDRPPPPVACDWAAAGGLAVRDPSLLNQTREASRFDVTNPASFQRQETRTIDACGEWGPAGRFDIRALDEQCLVEVRVPVLLVAADEPIDCPRFVSMGTPPCRDSCRRATTDAVAAQAAEWGQVIRDQWSRRHQIRPIGTGCPCPAYDVDVDVVFVAPGEDPNPHLVNVHSGCGQADSGDWYIDMLPKYAAHEFGHLLGLLDEFPKPGPRNVISAFADPIGALLDLPFAPSNIFGTEECYPVTDPVSMMFCCSVESYAFFIEESRVFPFHYHFFAEWLAKTRCCEFEIGRPADVLEGASFESF